MDRYTSTETSDLVGCKHDTLWFYKVTGLVSPKQADNGFYYYTSEDILKLKYLQLIRCLGYSLDETKKIVQNKNKNNEVLPNSLDNIKSIREIISKKKNQLDEIISILDIATEIILKSNRSKQEYMHDLINNAFKDVYF